MVKQGGLEKCGQDLKISIFRVNIDSNSFKKHVYISYFLFTVGPAESLRPGTLLIEVLAGS